MIDVKFSALNSSIVLPVFPIITLEFGIRRVDFVVQSFLKKISYLAYFAVIFLRFLSDPALPLL